MFSEPGVEVECWIRFDGKVNEASIAIDDVGSNVCDDSND